MKALSHPLRARLLDLLDQRTASPSQLADELGEPLPNVSYHVRRLLDLGCIELAGTEPRRGATEHYYRATETSLSRMALTLDEQGWEELSALLADLLDRATGIQAEATERLGEEGKQGINAELALMLFETTAGRAAPS